MRQSAWMSYVKSLQLICRSGIRRWRSLPVSELQMSLLRLDYRSGYQDSGLSNGHQVTCPIRKSRIQSPISYDTFLYEMVCNYQRRYSSIWHVQWNTNTMMIWHVWQKTKKNPKKNKQPKQTKYPEINEPYDKNHNYGNVLQSPAVTYCSWTQQHLNVKIEFISDKTPDDCKHSWIKNCHNQQYVCCNRHYFSPFALSKYLMRQKSSTYIEFNFYGIWVYHCTKASTPMCLMVIM